LASTEEIIAIVRRMDLDGDARLCKYEFIEGLKPEEPYSKMMKRGELNKSHSKSCLKGANSSFHHTRRSSHNGALNTSHFNYNHEEDLFNRDHIRTQALDRSYSRKSKNVMSRSPLKIRPVFKTRVYDEPLPDSNKPYSHLT
jgi:hypothetical protein